jgi:hypothetical protein
MAANAEAIGTALSVCAAVLSASWTVTTVACIFPVDSAAIASAAATGASCLPDGVGVLVDPGVRTTSFGGAGSIGAETPGTLAGWAWI